MPCRQPIVCRTPERLQEQDPDIQKLKQKLEHNTLDKEYNKMEDDLLKVEVNNMQVDTEDKSTLVQMPLTLLEVNKAISDQF